MEFAKEIFNDLGEGDQTPVLYGIAPYLNHLFRVLYRPFPGRLVSRILKIFNTSLRIKFWENLTFYSYVDSKTTIFEWNFIYMSGPSNSAPAHYAMLAAGLFPDFKAASLKLQSAPTSSPELFDIVKRLHDKLNIKHSVHLLIFVTKRRKSPKIS